MQEVVPQVVAAKPEGVIINGDAARLDGQIRDYEVLQESLAPIGSEVPVYIGLGNHDDRNRFFKVFAKPPGIRASVSNKHVVVIEHSIVRVIVLDSLLYTDRVAGLLGKAQRTWLVDHLSQHADRPAVLFLHHTLGDGDGDLLDTDRLFDLLQPLRHVKAVFFGHSHRWSVAERPGLKLINLPAVGYNFSDTEPVGWVDAQFQAGGVQLTPHVIAGNRSADGRTVEVPWA
jgi:3',5'-cyclic AMP phosphodiesterase CpdA